MSFSTPQTLSFTASAADANRLQAAATGLGYSSIKAMVITLVTQQVSAYEQHANQQSYAAAYSPVVPS